MTKEKEFPMNAAEREGVQKQENKEGWELEESRW